MSEESSQSDFGELSRADFLSEFITCSVRRFVTEALEQEVAEITNRALSTLRNDRFMNRGIPYIKAGRNVRYNLEDVLNYMESRKVVTQDR